MKTSLAMSTLSRLLLAIAAALLVASCSREPTADDHMESAKQYLEKNDRKAAVIELKNALQKDPRRAEARYQLGRALVDAGDFAAGEKELTRAKELQYDPLLVDPPLANAMARQNKFQEVATQFAQSKAATPAGRAELETALGSSFAAIGKADAAKVAFANARAAQPGYPAASVGLARLTAAGGDLQGALTLLNEATTSNPSYADAWILKGDVLTALQKPEDAIAAYRWAVQAAPTNGTAHAALVLMLIQRDNIPEAAAALEQYRKAAPKQPQVAYLDGMVKFRQNDHQGARLALQEFLRVVPESLPGNLLAGANEYKLRAYGNAEAHLTRVVSRMPNHEYARRLLISTYVQNGQSGKALQTLTPVLGAIDKDPVMLGVAGEVYLLNGNPTEATKYFTKAASLDPKDVQRQTALALSHFASGETERGMRELEQASSSDGAPRATMALILTSLQRRQYDKALADIAQLEKRMPDKPLPYSLRGLALAGKQDLAGARKNFERALELDATFFPAALELARLDVAAKQPEEARKRLEAFAAKEPKNVRAMLALAELRASTGGTPAEVAGLLEKAAAADPADPTARLALVQHHLRNKANDKALTVAQETVNAFPGRPQALEALARAQEATGNAQQAIVTYGRLAEAQPGAPGPYAAIAELQFKAREYEAASASLRQALQLKPDYVPAQRSLVALNVQTDRIAQAVSVARDVQKQRPKESVGYVLEGDVHFLKKNYAEAANAYRAGLKQVSTSDLAAKLHAALSAGAQRAEADKVAAAWVREHPDDTGFRMYLAQDALGRKDYATAVRDYEGLLSKRPNDPIVLNNLAWAAGKLNDPRAVEYAEKANQLAPNQAAIMDTLGMLLVERGNTERGVDLLQKASALAPQSTGIRLNLAKGLVKAGNKAQAKKELEQLSKLGTSYPGQEEVAQLMKSL